MPISYSIRGDLVVVEAVGTYEPEDVARRFVEALADPACPAEVVLIYDVTASSALASRNTEQIRYAAEFLGQYAARLRGRCAVVATQDIHFGLARMGAAYSEAVGVEVGVFRTRDEAIAWLRG